MLGTVSFGDANRPRARKGRWGRTAGNGTQVCLFIHNRHADTGRHSGRVSEAPGIRRGSLEGNTKVYKAVRLYVMTLNRPACA